MLRKQVVIELLNDEVKNICQIEHLRYRFGVGFLMRLIAKWLAYCFLI